MEVLDLEGLCGHAAANTKATVSELGLPLLATLT